MADGDRPDRLPFLGDAAWAATVEAHEAETQDAAAEVRIGEPLHEGSVLGAPGKHYVLGDELARGGLGRVLRAIDTHLDRPVAIKLLLRDGSLDQIRFAREAAITARLQHPSIIPVYDAGRSTSGQPFYSMRLVAGEPLSRRLRRCQSFAERLAVLPHVIAVAEAVAYAHSRGFIHRDLKPDNVLVGQFGETVVIDWGLAKYVGDDTSVPDLPDTSLETLTVPGRVMGTPVYMAPEQARGEPLDVRADVYAIGAILYRLLAGRAPYLDDVPIKVVTRVATEEPPPVERIEPGAPRDLVAIVHKATARVPAQRYASARELADDLVRFETGQLVAARSYSRWQRVVRVVRRNALVTTVTAVALLALLGVGTVSVRRIVAERDRADRERQQAEASQRLAVARADDLTLLQAKGSLGGDPTAAVAWLKKLSHEWSRWEAARPIALEAKLRGVADVLLGHEAGVWTVAYSADGAMLATGSGDHTIRLWSTASTATSAATRTARVLTGHENDVTGLAFSPDGKELASASLDGTVRLWDVAAGTSRIVVRHDTMALGVAYSPDGATLASCGGKGGVHLFRRDGGDGGGDAGRWFHDTAGAVIGVAFSPDGKTFAYAGEDSRVFLRDTATLALRTFVDPTLEVVPSVAFSPDGARLVTSSSDDDLRLWDVATGALTRLHGSTHTFQALFTRDGQRVLAGGTDKMLRVFHLGYGTSQALAGQDMVYSVATAPDGDTVATGSLDKSVRVWRLSGLETPLSRPSPARAFAFASPTLAAGGVESDVVFYDLAAHAAHTAGSHGARVTSVAFSPSSNLLASTGEDRALRFWDVATGAPLGARMHPGVVYSAAFAPDGSRVATGGQDGVLRIWKPPPSDDTTAVEIHANDGPTYGVAYAHDGSLLATAGWDHRIRLWTTATFAAPRVLSGHDDWVISVSFSPDGKRLASGGYDGTVRAWDVATGQGTIVGRHGSWVLSVQFAADGQTILSSGADGHVRLWDATTGREVWSRETGKTMGIARRSPDGVTIASGDDHGLRLWSPDVPDGPALGAWADLATNAVVDGDGRLTTP